MQIHISANDGVPIYLQIVNQVKYLIASGRLKSEEELPPIRVLADRLLVNPNTVARAYRELETAGLVEKPPHGGHVCCRGRLGSGSPRACQDSHRADRRAFGRARQMDISFDELVKLAEAARQSHATSRNEE